MLPYLTGQVKESPRKYFFYISDDGGVMAVRVGDYKLVFELQRAFSTAVWAEPMVKLRLPHIFNLRRDPIQPRRGTGAVGAGDRGGKGERSSESRSNTEAGTRFNKVAKNLSKGRPNQTSLFENKIRCKPTYDEKLLRDHSRQIAPASLSRRGDVWISCKRWRDESATLPGEMPRGNQSTSLLLRGGKSSEIRRFRAMTNSQRRGK